MATKTESTQIAAIDQIQVATEQSLVRRGARGLRRAWQRGMATAEYAVGVLAAVALAIVLLNIFTNNDFFTAMLKFVVGLIAKVGGLIP